MALLEYFCKDGEKEDIGTDLKNDGWTLNNPNPKGNQINWLFNNIFQYLNEFASKFSDYSLTTHTHSSLYLGIDNKANDSDKLDGKDSTEFALTGHVHNTFEQVWSGDAVEVANDWGDGVFVIGYEGGNHNIIVVGAIPSHGSSYVRYDSDGDLVFDFIDYNGSDFKVLKKGGETGTENITSIMKQK